jgi:hypothetical protein
MLLRRKFISKCTSGTDFVAQLQSRQELAIDDATARRSHNHRHKTWQKR